MRNGGETKVCQLRLAESNGRKDSPLFINVCRLRPPGRDLQGVPLQGPPGGGHRPAALPRVGADEGGKRSEHSIAADRVDFLPGGNKKGRGSSNRGGDREDYQEA